MILPFKQLQLNGTSKSKARALGQTSSVGLRCHLNNLMSDLSPFAGLPSSLVAQSDPCRLTQEAYSALATPDLSTSTLLHHLKGTIG